MGVSDVEVVLREGRTRVGRCRWGFVQFSRRRRRRVGGVGVVFGGLFELVEEGFGFVFGGPRAGWGGCG